VVAGLVIGGQVGDERSQAGRPYGAGEVAVKVGSIFFQFFGYGRAS
jgi:hypothetical protein